MSKEIAATNYLGLTPEGRLEALQRAVGDSMQSILQAARIYEAMQRAGDDLRQVPIHLRRMLGRLATNRMLPEVMQFTGRLRERVMMLPLPEQERIVKGSKIKLLTPQGDVTQVDPRQLEPKQVRQVFGDGFIRSPEEQKFFLDSAKEPQQPQAQPMEDVVEEVERARRGRPKTEIQIDHERKGAHINGFVSVRMLFKILEELQHGPGASVAIESEAE